MLSLIYPLLFSLAALCVIVQLVAYKIRTGDNVGNNPQFLRFQKGYVIVYITVMFTDWLHGPYLYKLYAQYGEEQAVIIIVFFFAGQVVCGLLTKITAGYVWREKLIRECMAFAVFYVVVSGMRLGSFGPSCIGHLLSGLSTSVLFSVFEAWYVQEHLETHDFPKEWTQVTFSKASTWNGLLAVIAGIFAEGFDLGPLSPLLSYMLAVPFILFAGIVVAPLWIGNYDYLDNNVEKLCHDGFKSILSDEKIFMIGAIEALYENVIYIIIFLWTPILTPAKPSLVLVFSCFMVCILIGQAVYHILASRRIPVQNIIIASMGCGLLANIICVVVTHPQSSNTNVSFLALLLFQFAVGLYFPAMGFLRSHIIPDMQRIGIVAWFRVPLNIISCVVLMLLHEDVFEHRNRMIFVVCVVLMTFAILCGVRFSKLVKNDSGWRQQPPLIESA